jgi:hypothetical protein
MDGIAHSQMVLADVSTVGKDNVTGHPYRNANVLYEVGIALACRQPSEVLLVRDDHDKFLFDVSTVPHTQIDFTDQDEALRKLTLILLERLNEIKLVGDARILIKLKSLTADELEYLHEFQKRGNLQSLALGMKSGPMSRAATVAIPRLLDKQVIEPAGRFEDGKVGYRLTKLGTVLAGMAEKIPTNLRAGPRLVDKSQSAVDDINLEPPPTS